MVDILLTNDDGYRSAGFLPLLKALSREFSVTAVTPSGERSWISKSITTNRDIGVRTVKVGGHTVHSVTGTPADCVQVGLYNILRAPPKLVVSGINLGVNAGHARILSSGTVGACMEASIEGVRSIASSIHMSLAEKKGVDFFSPRTYPLFQGPSNVTLKLVKKLFGLKFGQDFDLISVNMHVSATPETPVEVTTPFKAPYGKMFFPTGKGRYRHKCPQIEFKDMKKGTDLKALHEGKISVTPVSLDLLPRGTAKKVEDALNIW